MLLIGFSDLGHQMKPKKRNDPVRRQPLLGLMREPAIHAPDTLRALVPVRKFAFNIVIGVLHVLGNRLNMLCKE